MQKKYINIGETDNTVCKLLYFSTSKCIHNQQTNLANAQCLLYALVKSWDNQNVSFLNE